MKSLKLSVFEDQTNLLNKRSELFSKCQHANKYTLSNYKLNNYIEKLNQTISFTLPGNYR